MSVREPKTWDRGSKKPVSEIKDGDYRREFGPLAEELRRFNRLLACFWLAAFAALLAAWLVPNACEAGIVSAILLAIAPLFYPGAFAVLECPACRRSILTDVDTFRYCPCCGGSNLGPKNWFFGTPCNDCSARLGYNKSGKIFTVRSCPHCGVWLDDDGV